MSIVVGVIGPPGAGKTTLVGAFVDAGAGSPLRLGEFVAERLVGMQVLRAMLGARVAHGRVGRSTVTMLDGFPESRSQVRLLSRIAVDLNADAVLVELDARDAAGRSTVSRDDPSARVRARLRRYRRRLHGIRCEAAALGVHLVRVDASGGSDETLRRTVRVLTLSLPRSLLADSVAEALAPTVDLGSRRDPAGCARAPGRGRSRSREVR